jgi:hypothetical protein
MIPRVEASFSPAAGETRESQIILTHPVTVRLSTGYSRRLGAGSTWRLMGGVPQGAVYRSVDAPFTIKGSQVHEAYLVIHGGALVGFYLPGEHMVSPLPSPISLPIKGYS